MMITCVSVIFISCNKEDEIIDNTSPVVSVRTSDSDKLTDGDTIYFYGNTGMLEYDIAMSGNQKLVGCVFKYDDETVALTELSGSFQMSRKTDINKKLICEITIQSGNENFSFEYQWSVSFFVEPAESLRPRVNQDGYLELSWEKPLIFKENFNRYILYVNNVTDEPLAEITDLDQISYVVKSYSGSGCSFTLKAIYLDNKSWMLGKISMYPQGANLHCDYSNADSVLISWSNNYKATTSVIIDGVTVSKTKENFAWLPYATFGFPIENSITLSFSPYNENSPVYLWSKFETVHNVYLGGYKFLDDGSRLGDYKGGVAYNPVEDVLYFKHAARFGPKLSSRAFPDLKENKSISMPTATLISSYTDSKLLVYNIVYDGKGLNRINTLPLPGIKSCRSYALTNDNQLLYLCRDDTIRFYNMEGTILLQKMSFPKVIDDDMENVLIHISPDVSCIYFSDNKNGSVIVLNIENYAISKTHELTGPFSGGWCVNPVHSEQLFVSDGTTVKEYNGKDLSLVCTWNYAGMKVGNVDPKSGYLLAYNDSFAIIIDTKTKKVLHTRPVIGNLFYIYSHTLISGDGQSLYLPPFINR